MAHFTRSGKWQPRSGVRGACKQVGSADYPRLKCLLATKAGTPRCFKHPGDAAKIADALARRVPEDVGHPALVPLGDGCWGVQWHEWGR